MSHHAIIPAAGLGRRMERDDAPPKALLPVGGRPILLHALDALADRDTDRVTLIVGYARERFMDTLGSTHRGMRIDYAVNEDFATTEHGWSLYLARDAWLRHPQPVFFMDADNVFDPRLLDVLSASGAENTVLVDPGLDSTRREEELVLGSNARVTGFVRGHAADHPQCVGGFVGMNRFGPSFMRALFAFMDDFFARNGRGFKYERVLHQMLVATGVHAQYRETGDLLWVNVNHAEELALAEQIVAGSSAVDA